MKRKTKVMIGLASAILALGAINPRSCVSENLVKPFIVYRSDRQIQYSLDKGWLSQNTLRNKPNGYDVREGERIWQKILADRNDDGQISYKELKDYIFRD